MESHIRAQDLADVVFASGSVFNGLSTNRLDTRNFLATGNTEGVNSLITRSGALEPGRLRTVADHIGVDTRYGRHEPKPLTEDGLQRLVEQSLGRAIDPIGQALSLFVALVSAQPFSDGNKRTALFAAEGYLLHEGGRELVCLPTRDMPDGPEAVEAFNDLMARAYIFDETESVEDFLRNSVIILPSSVAP